ncbi:hypothetical protein AncyloWKF20_02210 [Ancylobacter sp. WKF20]|uniref:hypothetical protein n=1 Tax=Ancylobacter sp. WKF20 TaxID=3039801 RepID=UPI0024341E15|nr:hypothetical protein [Ancylobacter sp. WKF20]WGD30677.1 hypothetical protein AncyloWKF20_02210 [Ancylobacter sp. WKF20]
MQQVLWRETRIPGASFLSGMFSITLPALLQRSNCQASLACHACTRQLMDEFSARSPKD